MGQSIFDWEHEEQKQEPEQPVAITDQPENSWETQSWQDPWQEAAVEKEHWDAPPVEYAKYEPEDLDETARRGGMAWSAGIVFFSSVAFMLLFGWVVDYLLQVSPWGIVGGIILGSIIGFIQFFRISSQIFNPAKHEAAMRPLMTCDDDEK